jgi:hypothetical protein
MGSVRLCESLSLSTKVNHQRIIYTNRDCILQEMQAQYVFTTTWNQIKCIRTRELCIPVGKVTGT